MASESVPPVEVACVAVVQGLHGDRKSPLGDLDEKVVVRSHQTEAHAPPLETCRHAGKPSQELDAVDVVAKMGRCRPDAVGVDVEHAGGDVS